MLWIYFNIETVLECAYECFSTWEVDMPEKKIPPINALTLDEEYPFATSPFCEEIEPVRWARDQTVRHTTVGGRGVVGRLTTPK